ncbi:MAG: PKD domain-containing protein [Gemmatimonadota bacterium]|nr:PKD domain-containing protein [Gemmatimonadota bacterium]
MTDDDGATGSYGTSVTAPGPGEAPTASFTSNCTDLSCDFTDTSTAGAGPIVSWSWNFGDGNGSSVQHPSHAYSTGGTYTVTLVVTDDRGVTDTLAKSVTVPAPNQSPTASFTSSCTDLTCGFTDASADGDGTILTWSWDFGDGTTSSAQSPSHTYAATGTYSVTLTVTDDDGATDSATNSVSVIAPNQAPTAAFTWSCDGLTCSFTNESIDSDGTIQNSVWAFGDGWSSNAQHPNHTYGDAGSFTVTVTVTDDDGATDSYSETIEVGERPVASFTSACTGLDCSFTDTSTDGDGTVVFWAWNFGDGATSFAQNPSHAYSAAGTYTVTLTVDDNEGVTDSHTATVTVVAANQAPFAAFSSSCTDLSCAFTDASSDSDGTIVSWSWDFGDGNTSTAQNPSHGYGTGGTYTVTLTVTDDDGATDSVGETVSVTAPNQPPTAGFSSSCTDLSCAFTDASADADGAIVSWSWDFGDGTTSGAQNPSHGYGASGTYAVTLTVTDDDGATDVTASSVSVTAPTLITLSVSGYKVRGRQHADLTWSGANSASVDVYRDGVVILTTPNDGFQTDSINNRGGGSYTYRVCEAGSSTCSQEVTITF